MTRLRPLLRQLLLDIPYKEHIQIIHFGSEERLDLLQLILKTCLPNRDYIALS
jgi:hypothetical protein